MSKGHINTILVFVLVSVLMGCSFSPQRNFSDTDLLIDQSVMPENWAVAETSEKNWGDEGEKSGAYINFYATDTPLIVRTGVDIYRYSNSLWASFHYKRMLTLWSGSSVRGTDWEVPEDFIFASSSANKWHFACQEYYFSLGQEFGKERTRCVYLAQYNEFVFLVVVPKRVDERQFFTMDQIEDIILAVDKRISSYIDAK